MTIKNLDLYWSIFIFVCYPKFTMWSWWTCYRKYLSFSTILMSSCCFYLLLPLGGASFLVFKLCLNFTFSPWLWRFLGVSWRVNCRSKPWAKQGGGSWGFRSVDRSAAGRYLWEEVGAAWLQGWVEEEDKAFFTVLWRKRFTCWHMLKVSKHDEFSSAQAAAFFYPVLTVVPITVF